MKRVTRAAVEKLLLSLPGAALSVQWGDDHVFKVGGKMFAVLSGPSRKPATLSFKCSDLAYEMLTMREGVIPAPYLARAKWVMLEHLAAIEGEELAERLRQAHRIVAEKLPKKLRPAL
jgi:predicted DNA-binding protein (MmcQ/YjbR family)